MKLNDAAQILGLSGEVTKEEVKQASRVKPPHIPADGVSPTRL